MEAILEYGLISFIFLGLIRFYFIIHQTLWKLNSSKNKLIKNY